MFQVCLEQRAYKCVTVYLCIKMERTRKMFTHTPKQAHKVNKLLGDGYPAEYPPPSVIDIRHPLQTTRRWTCTSRPCDDHHLTVIACSSAHRFQRVLYHGTQIYGRENRLLALPGDRARAITSRQGEYNVSRIWHGAKLISIHVHAQDYYESLEEVRCRSYPMSFEAISGRR